MKRQTKEEARQTLLRLTEEHTRLSETGFAIDLRQETEEWACAVRTLGRHEAYRTMSAFLCARYRESFGREYLFSEKCVAFEIAYHADAYFWALRPGRSARHITTLLFRRDELLRHCEVIDISTEDVSVFRQRMMFSYAAGVRPCYRGTPGDPFGKGPFRSLRRPRPRPNAAEREYDTVR